MADLTNQLQAAAGASTGVASDADFENTVLLLHGDGTNGAQNNTFIDSSTNNFTITRNGNTTQGTFSPFSKQDGYWGALTRDRQFITIPASSDFDLINTDFTVEFFVCFNAFNTMAFSGNNFGGNGLATAVNGWSMGFAGSGTTVTSIEYRVFASSTQSQNNFTGLSIPFGVWTHIALVRSGSGSGNLKLYVNGVQQGSALTANTYSTAGSTFTFGSGSYTQNGTYSGNADYYVSNYRLTKSAVYTSNFTPSTIPLTAISGTTLLIFQDNRFRNNGTNTGAITSSGHTATRTTITPFSPFPITTAYSTSVNGGAGYFDGSGDYLSLADNAAFTLGSGNFTIELWVYSTLASTLQFICGQSNSTAANSSASFAISKTASNTVKGFLFSGSTSYEATSSGTLILNAWNHIAFVRDGNTARLYINGVQDGTVSVTGVTVNDSSNQVAIGRLGEYNAAYYAGYVSSFRQVVGTCLYTGGTTFTPPTAPLTAITNTSLLCNFTNAGIFDNTGFNALETVGNAQIDTTTKKYGTGSMEFDGNGDYLTAPNNDGFAFGTGDFTVEGWLYTNSLSSEQAIFDTLQLGGVSTRTTSIILVIATTGSLRFYTNSAYSSSTSNSVSINTWHHFAMVRSSGTINIYIDGVSGLSVANTINLSNPGCVIGRYADAADGYMNGYIDDLRITKGIARYTSNFTPPTAALPDIGA
jgi:hypothetical protein